MSLLLQARELKTNLDAISHAIQHEGAEDATTSKALSILADWAQGTYGSGSDTDIFIICPRTTDGEVILEGNYERVLNFFTNLGESQGVLAFGATLEYIRKGMPIKMEAFSPPWVTIHPLGERAVYVFDKDTMSEQQCTLKDVKDYHGRRICTIYTTKKELVLPRDAFTSRPPNHTFFNTFRGEHYRGTITELYILRAVVLIPKDRIRRALRFEKEILGAISSLKRMRSSALDDPEFQLPVCLKVFPTVADCVHLLKILDISVTRSKFKVWQEVMEILRQFKTPNDIGMSRIFAAIKEFSFNKVQPCLDILITQLTTVNDVSSFITGIKASSMRDQGEVRQWCTDRGDRQIMKILSSDVKTLPSLVQYGFVKGLPLLSVIIESLSEDKTVGFTFWASLVSHLDRQWQSVNSSSFAGAPLRELHFMVDCCITAMIPLSSEGAVYTKTTPDLLGDVRHNAEANVRRTVILAEICLRFSSARCGEVLTHIFSIPGDIQTKFDFFLRPLARNLRLLLNQYGFTIFYPPFFQFYRFLVGVYLGFCLNDKFRRGGESSLARVLCTKKLVCDHCEFVEEFLSSGDQSREFTVTNKEWKHLRYVFLKIKDKIFSPTVTSESLWKTLTIRKRPQPRMKAAKEFLEMIGNEEEILRLMEPFNEEVLKALRDEEPFDFNLCLQLPPSLLAGSSSQMTY